VKNFTSAGVCDGGSKRLAPRPGGLSPRPPWLIGCLQPSDRRAGRPPPRSSGSPTSHSGPLGAAQMGGGGHIRCPRCRLWTEIDPAGWPGGRGRRSSRGTPGGCARQYPRSSGTADTWDWWPWLACTSMPGISRVPTVPAVKCGTSEALTGPNNNNNTIIILIYSCYKLYYICTQCSINYN